LPPYTYRYKLVRNHEAVVKFCCRGTGSKGTKSFQAPLADPYAIPDDGYRGDVDAVMRVVVHCLLEEDEEAWKKDENQIKFAGDVGGGGDIESTRRRRGGVALCLNYLKKRVGVPRDMSYPAARALRAYLTWAEEQLEQLV
jgi:glutathione S-transferase